MSVPEEDAADDAFYFGTYRAPRTDEPESVRADLNRIVVALEAILGRHSRWTGALELEEQALHAGVTDPEGNIAIITGILDDPPNCWRTLIHEALHTFSPRFERAEYRTARGWEEGVVEQLQRLLRQRVLGTIGIAAELPEQVFASVDDTHIYNGYIHALETVRATLDEAAEPFYRRLLGRHLTQRFAVLQADVDALAETKHSIAKTQLLIAHKTLTGGVSLR